jgi:hypothetical protein
VTPVTALADRKNALAAAMSRFSLSLTSTIAPERSMARSVAPSTVHLYVCLVNVPALADPPVTPLPEVIDEGRRQLRLPIANRLIAEFDAPDQEHLWQIAQAQLVAKPPKDHE